MPTMTLNHSVDSATCQTFVTRPNKSRRMIDSLRTGNIIREGVHTHGGEDVQLWKLVVMKINNAVNKENYAGNNSRNTALGASSPAKPALHMPELISLLGPECISL